MKKTINLFGVLLCLVVILSFNACQKDQSLQESNVNEQEVLHSEYLESSQESTTCSTAPMTITHVCTNQSGRIRWENRGSASRLVTIWHHKPGVSTRKALKVVHPTTSGSSSLTWIEANGLSAGNYEITINNGSVSGTGFLCTKAIKLYGNGSCYCPGNMMQREFASSLSELLMNSNNPVIQAFQNEIIDLSTDWTNFLKLNSSIYSEFKELENAMMPLLENESAVIDLDMITKLDSFLSSIENEFNNESFSEASKKLSSEIEKLNGKTIKEFLQKEIN